MNALIESEILTCGQKKLHVVLVHQKCVRAINGERTFPKGMSAANDAKVMGTNIAL